MPACQRDLGGGVKLQATPIYNDRDRLISATFSFRYSDGNLTLPTNLHLRTLSGQTYLKPAKVRVADAIRDKDDEQQRLVKVMRVDIPDGPEQLNNIDFIFPDDSIKAREALIVRPVRFAVSTPPSRGMPSYTACGSGPALSKKYDDVITRLVAEHQPPTSAPKKLIGTWVLDPTATEKNVIATLPTKEFNAFMMVTQFLVTRVFNVEEQNLSMSILGNEKTTHFKLVAQEGNKEVYFLRAVDRQNQEASSETIAMTALNNKNISVQPSTEPYTQYLVWKKVVIDPSKKTPMDFKPEIDEISAAFTNIANNFNKRTK